MADDIDIARRIKKWRKTMGLTQSQFAELVNLSEDSIGKIERGISVPTVETLKKIAEGLKIPLSELIGEMIPKDRSQNQALEALIKYLRTKSSGDVKLIHELAVMILENKAKK